MRYISWHRILFGTVAFATAAILMSPVARTEPGKTPADQQKIFSGTGETHTTAIVFAIDAETNSVALLDEAGHVTNVIIDKNVGDVKKLKIGDKVSVTYTRALLLHADKSASSAIRERKDAQMIAPGSDGHTISVHRVWALATVVSIDRENRTVTIRDPTRTVILQASSERLLDGLEVGDAVRVDYAEATAVQISRDGAPLR